MRKKEYIMKDIKGCEKTIRCYTIELLAQTAALPDVERFGDGENLDEDEQIHRQWAQRDLDHAKSRVARFQKNLDDIQKQYKDLLLELLEVFYEAASKECISDGHHHTLTDYIEGMDVD